MWYKCILKITACLLLCIQFVHGQDQAWNKLMQLHKTYTVHETMSFDARLSMYDAKQPLKVLDQLKAYCAADHNRHYTKVGPVEIFRNASSMVSVDHDDKLILVTSVAKGKENDVRASFVNMGPLLHGMKGIGVHVKEQVRGGEYWLEITGLPAAEVTKYSIQYDPATFLIRRLRILSKYETETGEIDAIVDISYSNYKLNAASEKDFQEKRFVNIVGKKATLQQEYKDYTLINQL